MAKEKSIKNSGEIRVVLIGPNNLSAFRPLVGDAYLPGCVALGCLAEGEVAGAVVFSVSGGLAILDSIFVREKFRRQGVAGRLLDEGAAALKKAGIIHIMVNYGEVSGMTEFLSSQGFSVVRSGHVCIVDLRALADAGRVRQVLKEACGRRRVVTYASLTSIQKKGLQLDAREFGFSPELWEKGAIDTGLSFALMEEERPVGMILAAREGRDFLVTLLMNKDRNKTTLPILLSYFLAAALKKAVKGSRVRFFEKQKAMERFLKALMKGSKDPFTIIPCRVAIRSEESGA